MCPGIATLFHVTGHGTRRVLTFDLDSGPDLCLNAAGRLADMSFGIEYLFISDCDRAMPIATELDGMSRERCEIEVGMQQRALAIPDNMSAIDGAGHHTIAVCNETWHQDVIGTIASRIRDRFHHPVFTFTFSGDGVTKGPGRPIPGFHLHDVPDAVHKRSPGLVVRLGGHAMAAGLALCEDGLEAFVATFEAVGREWLTEALFLCMLGTNGETDPKHFTP